MDASGNTVKLTKAEFLAARAARDAAAGFTPEMRLAAQAKIKAWHQSFLAAKKRRQSR
jgi:hypothetical protein